MADKTKEIVKAKPKLSEIMAAKYNLNPEAFIKTLKATVMKPGKDGKIATDEEIAAFLVVAEKYNLNPFTNEIYAFPDKKKGGIVPVIGIDGFATLINRHPDYNGMEIAYSEEDTTMDGAKNCPDWCEVKMYRKNTENPTVVREYLDEVYIAPRSGFSGPWQTHTKRMLRHKAIIQAGRIAFGLTGIYDPDEAQRIIEAEAIDVTPNKKPPVEIPQAKSEIEAPAKVSEEPKFSILEQQQGIHILATRLKMTDELLYASLEEDYGVKSTKELTYRQAIEVRDKLAKQLAKQVKDGQAKL